MTHIEAIAFLRDCQRTHREWAEYFERDPEEEAAMCGTGEWDDAATHRKIERQYEETILLFEQLTSHSSGREKDSAA